ncbi:hypothetical protein BKA93DRAFT_150792 [Sparassis latifolia]
MCSEDCCPQASSELEWRTSTQSQRDAQRRGSPRTRFPNRISFFSISPSHFSMRLRSPVVIPISSPVFISAMKQSECMEDPELSLGRTGDTGVRPSSFQCSSFSSTKSLATSKRCLLLVLTAVRRFALKFVNFVLEHSIELRRHALAEEPHQLR